MKLLCAGKRRTYVRPIRRGGVVPHTQLTASPLSPHTTQVLVHGPYRTGFEAHCADGVLGSEQYHSLSQRTQLFSETEGREQVTRPPPESASAPWVLPLPPPEPAPLLSKPVTTDPEATELSESPGNSELVEADDSPLPCEDAPVTCPPHPARLRTTTSCNALMPRPSSPETTTKRVVSSVRLVFATMF